LLIASLPQRLDGFRLHLQNQVSLPVFTGKRHAAPALHKKWFAIARRKVVLVTSG